MEVNMNKQRVLKPNDFKNEQILKADKKVDILFLGDSITEHWETGLFFSEYGFVVNRGKGGETTEQILKRSDDDAFALKPEKLVFLAGINDYLQSSPDLWWKIDGKDFDEVTKTVLSNIEQIMKKCADNNIDGYFCSVLPTDFALPYNTFGIEDAVVGLNPQIEKLCEKLNMTYVDYFGALVDRNGKIIKKGMTPDGVHPLYDAYKTMADILKEKFNER